MKASKLSPPSCYIRPRIQSCILSRCLYPVSIAGVNRNWSVASIAVSQSECRFTRLSLSRLPSPHQLPLSPLRV